MRKWTKLQTEITVNIEQQLFLLAESYSHSLILTDQLKGQSGYYNKLKSEEFIAGFGSLETNYCNIHELSSEIIKKDWYFGFISYDMKNQLFSGQKHGKIAAVEFPDLFFFRPRWVLRKIKGDWMIGYDDCFDNTESVVAFRNTLLKPDIKPTKKHEPINLKPTISKEEYVKKFKKIQEHIQRGNIYEINYCMEFQATNTKLSPPETFNKLMQKSPMPFSAFLKYHNKYALSASPERYLMKKGDEIFSMPMKGTAPRGENAETDLINRMQLTSSEKERSENIMITDLVRNDLSRIASKGSVKVEELCGVYPFPNVFQVVSTISAKLNKPEDWVSPILHSFPMGSMTGAPKQRAMELISHFESSNRGLFSGSVGYITPEKDFDFNVMIRSLFYDKDKQLASYWAGSAITAQAKPEEEYRECMLKAEIVMR